MPNGGRNTENFVDPCLFIHYNDDLCLLCAHSSLLFDCRICIKLLSILNFYCRVAAVYIWSVPIVGGTSVTGALECPIAESRMIVSVDTSQMVC